jgi:putative endonuclease
MRTYYVYIVASLTRRLYIEVTNDLGRRMYEHKGKLVEGFTAQYNINRLVYYETTTDVHAAIFREKELKGWLRRRKMALVNSVNPAWKDLSADWYSAAGARQVG